MGCDIHAYAEKKVGDEYREVAMPPDWFSGRNYALFGFLANVRNYSAVVPFDQTEVPTEKYHSTGRGIPNDLSDGVKAQFTYWDADAHSYGWFTLTELLEFDYHAEMEDRRVTREIKPGWTDGGCTCAVGEGRKMTYREFLGSAFFTDLEHARMRGADRIVFWFDN